MIASGVRARRQRTPRINLEIGVLGSAQQNPAAAGNSPGRVYLSSTGLAQFLGLG